MSSILFPRLSEAEDKDDKPKNPWTVLQGGGTVVSQHNTKEKAQEQVKRLSDKNPDASYRVTNDIPRKSKDK